MISISSAVIRNWNNQISDPMFIQKFQVTLRDLENLAAQTADDAASRQEVIPVYSVAIGGELYAYHGKPPPQGTAEGYFGQGRACDTL
jgi:hypothetical protein